MINPPEKSIHGWPCRVVTPLFAILLLLPAHLTCGESAATHKAKDDVLLQAMQAELERSKSQMKMEGAAAPYYLEYRVKDLQEISSRAEFGALLGENQIHVRFLRVVVRVGDYKQDSYYGAGQGTADFIGLDDDMLALRHQLWLLTDRAYKTAIESLAAKRAALEKFQVDHPVDDFARTPAVQSIGPLVKLDLDTSTWRKSLIDATALYRQDPGVQSLAAAADFLAVNEYFVNSEGTVIRDGSNMHHVSVSGYTQAPDGMFLLRSPDYASSRMEDLPSPDQFVANAKKLLDALKALRAAPVVEEEYRGPVMIEPDAANDVVAALIGKNILGYRPRPGADARTTGEYASSYKSRVLPEFVSITDDPTQTAFNGHSLLGSYEFDDEGVKAEPVKVVENGVLTHYLLGRQPLRDFPNSNGHGRAAPAGAPAPSLGNLFLTGSQTFSRAELKRKMTDLCRQQDKPYGYILRTVISSNLFPLMLYRVYVKDGHEELVRGAVFQELDTRSLRNDLMAVGNDAQASNYATSPPTSVITPSLLFDELEIKQAEAGKQKLPEYPPPPVGPATR
ncbi:MAG TPA: metallopeptidase TldD-related protein [Terriglobia bacterium]|nr:metallopeptidase TldD-related protein [Terriglobia bacterium]